MKKKKDLIETLLDTKKELTAAKSQPSNKAIPSFVVHSNSNSDLNITASIENSELLRKTLTQEVDSNNEDGEEPPQNQKEKWPLQDHQMEVKKKKKQEFYAL